MKSSETEIQEVYSAYTPPMPIGTAVRRMVSHIPQEYLRGLRTIVIRDSGSLNHDRRRAKTWSRKKKVRMADCRGLYHERQGQDSAWIELFADNILGNVSGKNRLFWRIPFVQDLFLSRTLFHEIGHHIHKTIAPRHTEREDNADKWMLRLGRRYFIRKYWYLAPLHLALSLIYRCFKGSLNHWMRDHQGS